MDENKVTGTPNPDYIPPAQPVDETPVNVPQQLYVQQAIAQQQAQMQQAIAAQQQAQMQAQQMQQAQMQQMQQNQPTQPQEAQPAVEAVADQAAEPMQAENVPEQASAVTNQQPKVQPPVVTPPVQGTYTPNNGYNPYVPPTPPKNQNQDMANGMAIAAIICGAVGLVTSCCCMGGVPAILGVVFGIIALANRTDKKPLAIVGLALGAAAVLLTVVIWIYSCIVGTGVMDTVFDEFTNDYYEYEYEYDIPFDEEPFDYSYDYNYDDFM